MRTVFYYIIPIILLRLAAFSSSAVADESWRSIVSEWRDANAGISTGKADPRRVETASANLRAWLAEASVDAGFEADARAQLQSAMLNFPIAEAWAHAGDFQKASFYLKAEIANLQNTEGGFLNNTRNPDLFAVEVFELHSDIMAQTGEIGPIGGAGYDVFAVPDNGGKSRFAFVYQPIGNDEGGVLIEGLAEDEERRIIHLTEGDKSGKYRTVDRAQVVAKRDGFSVKAKSSPDGVALVMDGITKVIEYKGEFNIPVMHLSPRSQIALRVLQGKLEQPLHALALAESGKTVEKPPGSLPPQSGPSKSETRQEEPKAPELKSSKASQEATKSTLWLVLGVIVIAAIFLLNVVIRNQK